MEENIINTAGSELLGPDGTKLTIGSTIRKSFKAAMEVKDGERAVIATVSTDAIDRDMEVVLPKGVDLTQFRANPVVLWAHDYKQPPIGRCQWIKLSKDRRRLIAKTEFNHTPMGETVFNLYRDGHLSAFSIGFMVKAASPPSVKEMEERPELEGCWAMIRESVMLEYSAVPVPSNPEALAIAVSKGMSVPGELRKILVSVPSEIKFQDGDLDEPAADDMTAKAAEATPEEVEAVVEEKSVEPDDEKAMNSGSGPDGGYLVDQDDDKKPKKDEGEEEEEAAKPKKDVEASAEDEKGMGDSEERCDKCGKLKGECECDKSKAVEPEIVKEVADAPAAESQVAEPEASPAAETPAAEVVAEPVVEAKDVEPETAKSITITEHTPPEEIVTQALADALEPKAAEERCDKCGKGKSECECDKGKAAEPKKCETCGKPVDECKCGDKASEADEEPDEDNKPGGKPDGDEDDSKSEKGKPKPVEPDGDEDEEDDDEGDGDADDAKGSKGVDAEAEKTPKLVVFRTRKQVEIAFAKYLESIDFMAIIEKMIADELDRRRGRI